MMGKSEVWNAESRIASQTCLKDTSLVSVWPHVRQLYFLFPGQSRRIPWSTRGSAALPAAEPVAVDALASSATEGVFL